MSCNPEKTGFPQPSQQPPYNEPGPGYPAGQPTGQGYPPPAYGPPTAQPVFQGQPQGFGQASVYPSNVVVQPQSQFVAQTGVRPSDYLILSIVAIFFCWPMAICAIMYSLSSRSAADTNNYNRAMAEGRTARSIGIAAIVLGIVIVAACVAIPLAVAGISRAVCTGPNCI